MVQLFFMSKTTYQIDIDGYIGDYAYSKRYVRNILENNKNNDVFARFNSLGGNLDHGLDIAERFRDHGNVTVDMFGFNASSSTLASLGAKKVRMSSAGFYLIHKCMNWIDIWGSKNADEIEQIIADLKKNKEENDKIDLIIAQQYSNKTGKTINEILPLMKVGGWLTANEAKEWGFIDEIIKSDEKINMASMEAKFNAFGLPTNRINTENLFTNIKNPVTMKRQFEKVNAILGVAELASTEEGVYVQETQLEAIENNVTTLQTDVATQTERANNAEADATAKANIIAERDNTIAQLNAQIANLQNGAGADNNDVTKDNDASGKNPMEEEFKIFNAANELYKALP